MSVGAGVAAVTTNVTGTVCGLLEAPEEVMVMLPLYVPAARPAGLAVMLRLPGVVPLAALAVNHAAEDATV